MGLLITFALGVLLGTVTCRPKEENTEKKVHPPQSPLANTNVLNVCEGFLADDGIELNMENGIVDLIKRLTPRKFDVNKVVKCLRENGRYETAEAILKQQQRTVEFSGMKHLSRLGIFFRNHNHRIRRLADVRTLWPKSQDGNVYIPYSFDESAGPEVRAAIENAKRTFAAVSCIRWIPWSTELNYVKIISASSGCWALIGRQENMGMQYLNLQFPGCTTDGITIHEMLHTLSFRHTMTRGDRDEHVKILFENIVPTQHRQFEKISYGEGMVGERPFHMDSVMMYGSHDFTINGKKTIIYRDDPSLDFKPIHFTEQDAAHLNRMYQCEAFI